VRESEPILVVEDDPASREVIVALLAQAGLSAVAVSDAATALAWLEGELPAVVLLDVMLPGMDGFELLRRIRNTEGWADLPVVVLTALDSEEAIERSFASGADDFCSKPVR
jgi:CheY-like chemotaxis protein